MDKVKIGFQEKIFQGAETIKPENKNFKFWKKGENMRRKSLAQAKWNRLYLSAAIKIFPHQKIRSSFYTPSRYEWAGSTE
jgi:hypothetical protein